MATYKVKTNQSDKIEKIKTLSEDGASIAREAANMFYLRNDIQVWPAAFEVTDEESGEEKGIFEADLEMVQIPYFQIKCVKEPVLTAEQIARKELEDQAWTAC